MIKCQNSIVTANVWSVHHQLQATTPTCSRLIWESFYSLVDLWQVVLDNLKRFLEFGACFWLCFKLAVSLQHCIPYDIFGEFGGHLSFMMISGQLARSQFCALRSVARCVCWRAVLLEDEYGGQPAIALKNDNLVIIYKQYKLLFIKTSLWHHLQ